VLFRSSRPGARQNGNGDAPPADIKDLIREQQDVLVQVVKDKSNPNYDLLQENLTRLKQARDAKGRQLDIIEMDVLPYSVAPNGQRCAIPYTNAYVVNGGIITPEVDPKLDDRGFDILQQAFPGREIATCRSEWQAVGGGGIGCMTQQVPASQIKGV